MTDDRALHVPSLRGAFATLVKRCAAPSDVAWLAAFRILFGIVMAVSLFRFLAYGWVDELFIQRDFHFKYFGFHWIESPGPRLTTALFVGLMALALCISLGVFFRVTAWLFALGFAYLQLLDVTNYLNHYYLAVLLALLLAVSPAHRAWSFDAWRRSRLRVAEVSSLWLYLFRFQIGVVYTFAGLAKAYPDWLIHAQPLRIWLASRTDHPLLGRLFELPQAALAMSWMGFLFDSTIVWFLLWRRTRLVAYCVVIGFHLATSMMFPIGMFPVIMIVSALVFFPPSWPRSLLRLWQEARRLLSKGAALAQREPGRQSSTVAGRCEARAGRRFRVMVLVGLVYCAIQLLVPLRFLAYGGDVRWHEQGMRFSWRVMVREKNGSTNFLVHSPERGRTFYISPGRYLTRLQEREMSGQPDLILQLAHHIADDFERQGYGKVSVYVDALVSLNGRRVERLIDPNVDLTRVSDGIRPAAWILPAPRATPPHTRPVRVAGR